MKMIDVKAIGRWSKDLNLGHIRKWKYTDLQKLIASGCRVSQTEHVYAPIDLLEGEVPFGMDGRKVQKVSLTLNDDLKVTLVNGREELNMLEEIEVSE